MPTGATTGISSSDLGGKYDRLLLPDNWEGDGVIARVTHEGLAHQILERKIPAVNVSWFRYGGNAIPQCTCDEVSIAELAANYFVDRGFRQFAYCACRCGRIMSTGSGKLSSTSCIAARIRAAFRAGGDPDGFLPSSDELDRMIAWLRAPSPNRTAGLRQRASQASDRRVPPGRHRRAARDRRAGRRARLSELHDLAAGAVEHRPFAAPRGLGGGGAVVAADGGRTAAGRTDSLAGQPRHHAAVDRHGGRERRPARGRRAVYQGHSHRPLM